MSDDDALFALLSRLPRTAPRTGTTERMRAKSHELLAARRDAAKHRPQMRIVDLVLVFLSVSYLAGAIGQVVALKRLIP